MSSNQLKVGDAVPDATFLEVPYSPELESLGACGMPVPVKIREAFAGKKVVVIAIVSRPPEGPYRG